MKIKHLLREQADQLDQKMAQLQEILSVLEKITPQIQKVVNDNHYEFEEIESQVRSLSGLLEESKIDYYYSGDIATAINDALQAVEQANGAVYNIYTELQNSIRSVNLGIDQIELDQNEVDEDFSMDEAKASRALCIGSKPDAEIGASQLASCKSQGLRARDGKKSHKIGKQRVTVGGHKIKGKKYGGPLPDYGTRKDQK